MNPPIYEIRSIEQSYAAKTVLAIDHLAIQPASIVGLIGPNGSGKSTLLRLLGLIERPVRGQILFNGRAVEPFSEEARFLITLLPQEPFLMKRTVFNNVSYGLKLRGVGRDLNDRVDQALSMVGLSGSAFARRPWSALSGGEAQRVALAARLALQPRVLLLDEPTASVDAASAQLIKEASLKARQDLGTTLVVASHDWQWLYEICDEVFHLYNGRIFGTGRETIVYGPWQELQNGSWGKTVSDGQLLPVPRPPGQELAAVIDVLSVSGNRPDTAAGDVVLHGTVSRLSLEKNSGQIVVTVMAGTLSFTIASTPDDIKKRNLFPGKNVFIHYRLDQVRWI